MNFKETALKGAWTIDFNPNYDDRGYFSRFFCRKEFEAHGIESKVLQGNLSFSKDKGTLRGMHYQIAPFEETKLMQCVRGSVFDVIIDLRPGSQTYMQHFGLKLTAKNKRMLFVPRGFAHGFLSLEKNTEMCYLVSEYFSAESARGIRYDDPILNIQWPAPIRVVSNQDATWPFINAVGGDFKSD